MEITAAVARSPNAPFSMEVLELEAPREGEILVRIAGVGLCHTDLVARAGGTFTPLPAVLGHEGAGVVEEVGPSVTEFAPDDRVILSFLSCGSCPTCAGGNPAYCHSWSKLNFRGRRVDGSKPLRDSEGPISGSFFGQSSMATHALGRASNAHKVPDNVPLEIMGVLGCGVQTGAGAVMRSLECRPGSSLLVIGGGAVGLSAVMGAVLQGCSTIVVAEPHESRRTLALELGATEALQPGEDLGERLRAIAPVGFDYVLDTSGNEVALNAGASVLAPHGSFGFVGMPADPKLPLPGTLIDAMMKGHTFRGIIEGDSDPKTFIPQLIEHYQAGRFPFDKLIKTYPLAAINEAVEDHVAGRCVKAVLLPEAS